MAMLEMPLQDLAQTIGRLLASVICGCLDQQMEY
jgi:hypothetical protein